MIIISNNVQSYTKIPRNAVIRINMAWIHDMESLYKILDKNRKHDIFLDFNSGRTKPPSTNFTFEDALQIMNTKNVSFHIKYFAISNAEDIKILKKYRMKVPSIITLVPKIETALGILRLVEICKACKTDIVMLDKDDLWISLHNDSKLFNEFIDEIRKKGKENNIRILELQGVIFAERN